MNINIKNNFGIVSTGDSSVNIVNLNIIKELEILEKNVTDKEEIQNIKLLKQNVKNMSKFKVFLKKLKKETISLIKELSLKVLETLIIKYL